MGGKVISDSKEIYSVSYKDGKKTKVVLVIVKGDNISFATAVTNNQTRINSASMERKIKQGKIKDAGMKIRKYEFYEDFLENFKSGSTMHVVDHIIGINADHVGYYTTC